MSLNNSEIVDEQLSLSSQADVDEKIIIMKGIKIFPDISVMRCHFLFRIYDFKITDEIAQGQWVSLGVDRVFQNKFDRYSTYFFQVVQDLLTIVDLKNKTLTNKSIEGISRYLDIDDNGYIYLLLRGSNVCQYSINDKEFKYNYMLNGLLDLNILPSLSNYALTIQAIDGSSWLFVYNIHKQKLSKRIRQTKKRGNEIQSLDNHLFVEIINRIEDDEYGEVSENIEGITLREMRTGKIIRNSVNYKEFQRQQHFIDKTQVTIIDQYKFDLLRGRQKVAPQIQDCITFSKNGFIYMKKNTLRFSRFN
ncbi:unnamed protein product [Paramecium octaurelia]|uniref:Uncharacterized protein n=1 Tax=Paramecium octaurelia TaxID=43137 RepID=A0A8S1UGJ0_PAROT|nr:unnamed protein product [Paramecium octaurelia]